MKNKIQKFAIYLITFVIMLIIFVIMLISAKYVSDMVIKIAFFILEKFIVISRNAILEIMFFMVLVKVIIYILTIVIFSKGVLDFINSKEVKKIFKR